MGELTVGVNWISVIVGAVASFILGWLWFSPMLFGKKWADGVGVDLGTADEMPAVAMVAQGIGLLLMSWFVAVTAASNALLTVILGTVAFTVLAFSNGSFVKKSDYAKFVEAGYWVVCLVVMIAVQAIF